MMNMKQPAKCLALIENPEKVNFILLFTSRVTTEK